MSNPGPLVLLASLAACEHIDTARVEQPDQPAPEEAVDPVVRASVKDSDSLANPKPAVALQPQRAPLDRTDELDRRCMTRAGCRWGHEVERPRITKKLVVPVPAPAEQGVSITNKLVIPTQDAAASKP
jgi:hypothetical protein